MEHVHDRWSPEKAVGKPQYLRSDVDWQYVAGYYDGPFNGRVRLRQPNGDTQSLWAQIFEECNEVDADENQVCGFYRRYLLYRLTPESHAESEYHKYYARAKHWPEWEPKGEVVGWFEI